jgi:hypothetical protein
MARSGHLLAVAATALLLPALGLGATPGDVYAQLALESGPAASLTSQSLSVAYGLLPLFLVAGLVVELLVGGRDVAGVFWRLVLVLAGLSIYTKLMPQFVSLAEELYGQLAPPGVWGSLAQVQKAVVAKAGLPPAGFSLSGVFSSGLDFGRLVSTGLLNLVVVGVLLLGTLAAWLLSSIACCIIALLYVVGPLVLAAYLLPGGRRMLGEWFRSFVALLLWPILAVLIAAISVGFLQGAPQVPEASWLPTLAVGLLSALCILSVPMLTASIVGGGLARMAWKGVVAMATQGASAAADAGKKQPDQEKDSQAKDAPKQETAQEKDSQAKDAPKQETAQEQQSQDPEPKEALA